MLNSALNEIYTESISYTKCKVKYNWYGNGDIRALMSKWRPKCGLSFFYVGS